ncbi:polysaccharide biosynthesis tyrosine autokinase [Thiohalorhabdus denitrificans]|uniref:Tyrosine-protein kinase Etk/Wzc n=1 Tax=Thiohalorhabdus denitrificans TaxID=381306 RepID=A0A1G5C679_9GAMM|nr:polysaccharide biosynthesis tyrosine autokinase [Thiohalorhabdus denitrificans]SCX97955.1 tyrosine-protein kinase Etk/Wzc [Thiohalorhabdus denitrificans]
MSNAPTPPRDDEFDLQQVVATLLEGKWLIVGVTALALAVGLVMAQLPAPVYKSNAMIQVETEDGGVQSLLSDSPQGMMVNDRGPTATQIQILKSRNVLSKAVEDLDLDILAEPNHFPYVGGYLAREANPQNGLAEPWFGLDSYAWGGEEIEVKRLEVDDALKGRDLTLVAGEEGRYRLRQGPDRVLLEGRVGQPAQSESPRIDLFVSRLKARPGTTFTIRQRSWLAAVSGLQDRLQVQEKGQDTGILQLSMEGEDPERIGQILDSVARFYQQQNVERRSAEAEESLNFLQEQLPRLKEKLRTAENKLNTFRQENSAVDITAETQTILDRVVEVENRISELEMERAEVGQKLGEQHPTMQSMERKRRELEQNKEQLQSRIQGLPDTQQELLRLKRDVEVQQELYTSLLNKSQELRLSKAGTIGNVRIVDEAILPERPSGPNRPLIFLAAGVVGLIGGSALVFLRKALRTGIQDPDSLSQKLGLPIFAVVPHNRDQERAAKRLKRGKKFLPILAVKDPTDPTVEALRSLRTSLAFALLESDRKVVTITSPIPSSGKTFITINLASLVAETGQKVLVIDADLRKGHLHYYLDRERSPGLTDFLAGEATEDQIKTPLTDNLTVVSSGTLPPNPTELLISQGFIDFLARAQQEYDLVLVDTAPLIPVTDATLVGAQGGAMFMVVRGGVTNLAEVEAAERRASQHGVSISGLVYNDLRPQEGYGKYGAYGGYRYYNYKYE